MAIGHFLCTNRAITATPKMSSSSETDPGAVKPALRAVGYPEPVVVSSDLHVGGYYLDGAHKHTGVLTMIDFFPTNPAEYQATIQSFLAEMKKDGKTKIIIDMSGNTGCFTALAFDAFRQFFPAVWNKATRDSECILLLMSSQQRPTPLCQRNLTQQPRPK